MIYVEAPNIYLKLSDEPSLFMGGGITGCPDWQKAFIYGFFSQEAPIAFLNPRREKWPMGDPEAAFEQIEWEHIHLELADAVLFWFCAETIQPITLFELGRWSSLPLKKPLFVGVDPNYERKSDIEIQMKLERPVLKIASSIAELASQVREWVECFQVQ